MPVAQPFLVSLALAFLLASGAIAQSATPETPPSPGHETPADAPETPADVAEAAERARAATEAAHALDGLIPEEGACPTVAGGPGSEGAEDAIAVTLKEGMTATVGDILSLRQLFPPEIWKFREIFFYEGMRMEIGACHRRYATGPWYSEATREHGGSARVDDAGNLEGYVAGLPFPPENIDPESSDAPAQWAWNYAERYRGSGPVGSFRLFDLPSRLGAPETYEGSFFFLRTANRADLAETDYHIEGLAKHPWVAGGSFDEPFNARHLAWRQLRREDSRTKYKSPDDTFVYVPTMRKVRRSATPWVDGMYLPRYSAAGTDGGGGGVPFGSNPYGPAGAINPTSGLSVAATENHRRGFVGISLRPNAYVWRYRGERTVLAPLNSTRVGYPESKDRNYGTSGLSVASDRWDVRYAVIIEGRARRVEDGVAYVELWIDYQTQQPLYVITRRENRLLRDVGILVHRFSGDLPRYPEWPGRGAANVFDPVAAVFFDVGETGSGWRRESYDIVSVPVDAAKLKRMTTTDSLLRGH